MDNNQEGVKNTSTENNGTSEAAQNMGGIFSSSELTVNTDSVPAGISGVDPVVPVENNSERVASVFGRNLNSRNHAQGSRYNSEQIKIPEDMAVQNNIPSTATGDISLSGIKKRHKAPLIVAVIAVFAAAGAIAALFFTGVIWPKSTKETPLTAFEKYLDLIKYGPEELRNSSNEEQDTKDWFIFAPVGISDEGWLAFSDDVYKTYDSFLKKGNGIIDEDFPEYPKVLRAVLNSTNLPAISGQLLDVFVNLGGEAAIRYVNETTPEVGDGTFYFTSAGRVSDALENYLRSSFSLYEAYNDAGCLNNMGVIDNICLEDENPKSAIIELLEQQSDSISAIYEYQTPMQEYFQAESERLLETLKELYEK